MRVAHFVRHVAIDGVRNPRAGKFDEILIVDRAVDSVLSVAEGDDRHPLTKVREPEVGRTNDGLRDGLRVSGGQRRLYESVRAEHHLELPQFGVGNPIEIHARERHGLITLHVPCDVAAQDICDVVASLLFVVVHAHILGVVVDRARVVRNLNLRPAVCEVVLLTHVGYKSVAGKLNRLQVRGAHGLGGRFNRFTGVHRLSGCCPGAQCKEGNKKNRRKPKISRHFASAHAA